MHGTFDEVGMPTAELRHSIRKEMGMESRRIRKIIEKFVVVSMILSFAKC
jgi:hypothetical protein